MPMVCNQRNRTPSQIDVLRSAKYNLERITKDASDEQTRQRDNVISHNVPDICKVQIWDAMPGVQIPWKCI